MSSILDIFTIPAYASCMNALIVFQVVSLYEVPDYQQGIRT